jgi:predicted cupin superfamily sugar epimerase
MTDPVAKSLIATLKLEPHPEGGWFRQTWRAEAADGERATATAIHFLLESHQSSHWHRVDAAELWMWHSGSPIALMIAPDDGGPVTRRILGGDVLAGQAPQVLVPKLYWQAAVPLEGWSLVSCVVSPGFEYSGFELAPEGWRPSAG